MESGESMFIKSFRLKDLIMIGGVALLGLALGIGVLLLAAHAAGSAGGDASRAESAAESSVESAAESSAAENPPDSSSEAPAEGSLPAEGQKTVYLTYDDGPSAMTAEILDVLKEKEVPATFFVIGATTGRGKALYQRILDEGHAIGLHTYSHRYQQIYESADAFLEDYRKLSDCLAEAAGVEPDICRFPGGSANNIADPAVLKEIKAELSKEGIVWFDWNALAKDDGASAAPAEEMFQNILESAGDSGDLVILMHDDALRSTAAECTAMLIDHYRELGYTFGKLTAETPCVQFPDR